MEPQYIPKPAEISDMELPSELLELSEVIAKNVHEVWAQNRIKEGWTYGDARNDEFKKTPCLVPYEELPEIEKDYDRNTAINTLKLIKKMGFDIVPPNDKRKELKLPHSKIHIDNVEIRDHLQLLFQAILNVSDKYIHYSVLPIQFNNNEEQDLREEQDLKEKQHLERVFAYELYHQWSNVLSSNHIENVLINGEIYKNLKIKPISTDENGKIIKEVYPDLVLHASQGNDKKQFIICEIKRAKYLSDKYVFADLLKISCYLSDNRFDQGKRPFELGVFIVVGEHDLKKIFEIKEETTIEWDNKTYDFKQFKEEFKDVFNRIICLKYDGNDKSLEYNSLSNLIFTNTNCHTYSVDKDT